MAPRRKRPTSNHSDIQANSPAKSQRKEEVQEENETETAISELKSVFNRIEEDRDAVVGLFNSLKSFGGDSALRSLFEKSSPESLEKLWSSCQLYTTETILNALGPDSSQQGVSTEDLKESLLFLDHIVTLARAHLSQFPKFVDTDQLARALKTNPVQEGFVQTVLLLHNFLPSISDENETLKNNVAKLCEDWYTKSLPEKDSLILNCFTYLVTRTLHSAKAVKADVKRVYAVRASILSVNLKSSTNEKLRQLLLQSAKSPVYLKSPEGVKFIAFLFTLSPSFIPDLHKSIKEAIPGALNDIATALADVYYKAWQNSSGSFRSHIEEDCIQDLMYHGVLANRTLPKANQIFPTIFKILDRFHQEKNCKDTQTTLHRLWQPILWRHLCVANAHVRINAAKLFLSAFPVENPNECLATREEELESQIVSLLKLLDDETVDVRVVAIEGVSRILNRLWLILSSSDINRLVKVFVKDLAFDASSPKVRTAVLRGLRSLVADCPRSHLYLKEILPRLSDCLHDVNETVRVAMLDLLLSVKKVRPIKFWEISSLEHLLARLAVDKSSSVAQRVVQLLSPSFFPINQREEAKVERCIVMIQTNRLASRRFYQFLAKVASLHDCVSFMLAILVNIKRFVKYQLSLKEASTVHSSFNGGQENKENEGDVATKGRRGGSGRKPLVDAGGDRNNRKDSVCSDLDNSMASVKSDMSMQENRSILANKTFLDAFSDPTMVTALLDIVCILWVSQSVQIAKPENKEYRGLLDKKATGILTILFKYYKSDFVCRPVIYMCSFLPSSSVTPIVSFCLSRVRNADNDNTNCAVPPTWSSGHGSKLFPVDDPLPTYIDSICNWSRADDLLEIIYDWLQRDVDHRQQAQEASAACATSNTGQPQRPRRGVRFAEAVETPKTQLAFTLLRYVLRHTVNKSIILRKNRPQLENMAEFLKTYIPIITKSVTSQNETATSSEEQLILSHAWDLILKINLLVFLHRIEISERNDTFLTVTGNLIAWATETVIPILSDSLHKTKNILAEYIINSLIHLTSNLVLLDLVSGIFITNAMELLMRLIERVGDISSLKLSASFGREVAAWSAISDDPNVGIIYSRALPDFIRTLLGRFSSLSSDDLSHLQDLKKDLQQILVTYKVEFNGPLLAKDFIRPIIHEIIQHIKKDIQGSGGFTTYDSIKELPSVSAFLMDVVSHKSSISGFLNEWIDLIVHPQPDVNTTDLAANVALVQTILKTPLNATLRSELKILVGAVERLLEASASKVAQSDVEGEAGDLLSLEMAAMDAVREVKASLAIVGV